MGRISDLSEHSELEPAFASDREAIRDLPLSFAWSVSNDHVKALGLHIKGGPSSQFARRALAANLYLAHSSDLWLSYSRNRNHYSPARRYHGAAYSYAHVLAVVDELNNAGLVAEERAKRGQLGWQSRIRAAPKFLQLLPPIDWLPYSPGELVRLKDSTGKLVDYADTNRTRTLRRQVAMLNEALASASIRLSSSDIRWNGHTVVVDRSIVHPTQIAGYRVFNTNWSLGGRYYGPFWQSLPKTRRLDLTIDEAPVTELDFAQLHPRLLYAEFGAHLIEEAYKVPGHENDRPLIKTAWQMMINAQSRRSASAALAKELGGPSHLSQANCLLTALEKRHDRIRPAFYTGAGLRLQRSDSDLMMSVEQKCLAEGIIALPVHDSFIVKQGRTADRVQEIMQMELGRILNS
jgi:hypothetical protein